jgi:hypothetical protein
VIYDISDVSMTNKNQIYFLSLKGYRERNSLTSEKLKIYEKKEEKRDVSKVKEGVKNEKTKIIEMF